jgi:hypothetical protein
MAQTKTKKRGRLKFDAAKAKASLKPAALNLAGAVVGGIAGAVAPPIASGIGGLGCILAGAYTGKNWLTTAGAGMLVSTTHAVAGGNMRTSGEDEKKTFTQHLEEAKERTKAFLSALGSKFTPGKDAGTVGRLGLLGNGSTASLDDIEASVVASALDFRHGGALPSANLDGLSGQGGINLI